MVFYVRYVFEISDPGGCQKFIDSDDPFGVKVEDEIAKEENVVHALNELGLYDFSKVYDARAIVYDENEQYLHTVMLTQYSPM